MSRLEWILGILLVILLGIVIVLSLVFWFRPDQPRTALPHNSATTIAERADDIAPTPIFEGETAQIAFATAQQAAARWQSDAILLNASSTWPQGASRQDLIDGETSWGFTFYSPSSEEIALFSAIDGQANLVSASKNPQEGQPMQVTAWKLDSRDAIQQFFDSGGSMFAETQGITILTMMLSLDNQDGRIEWLISLFATETGNSLTMRIDATSGEILNIDEV